MPRKLLGPCIYPGCNKRAVKGSYCEEHSKLVAKQYNQFDRHPDHNKRYGRRWRVIRNQYAIAHPLCELCLKEGKYTPMEVVHHILPVDKGGSNEWSNLQSLCEHHHQLIHSELNNRGRGI